MSIKYYFILLSTLSQLVYANPFVEGYVKDKNDAIPFANIMLKDTQIGTSSDANGYFRLSVPEGNHTLIVTAMGYHKFKKNISVEKDAVLKVNPILAETTYAIDPIVVTGTLKESFVKVSPVKVEVLTSAFLRKTPTNNIMEIIETVNGVQKQINCGVCGTSDIHINGMEGPYSLILIDGMPIMSSLSTVYGLNGIPSSLIKQIEIIKGPSSTLYGTEAVAGVINIITNDPKDISKLEIESYWSSHQEKNLDISWSPKWKKADMLFSANLFEMDHFMDDNKDGFADEVLSNRLSLFNKWSFHRKSGKAFDLTGKYYLEDRFGGLEAWSKEYRGSDSIYGESIYTDRWELSSRYKFNSNENVELRSSFNYHHQDSYYGDSNYEAKQNTFFNQLLWYKDIGLRHQFTSGISYKYDSYDDNTPATKTINETHTPGVFIQDEMAISDQWKVLTGIRWDQHVEHGAIFAPRINLKWNPSENTSLRWNTGTGFRVVHLFTEDHAALTGARDVVIAEELEPEESINFNFNFHHWFQKNGHNTSIDIDLFHTHFSNKIVPDYDSNPSKIFYGNLEGYSISRGASFQINHSFSIPMNLSLGGTFLDVYSKEGGKKENELFAPEFSGVFSLGYEWPTRRIKIDYTGRITGPMHLPTYADEFSRAKTSPWYTLQHLKIEKEFSNCLSTFIGIRNLWDYTQGSPLIDADKGSNDEDSWNAGFSPNFDTAYVYGPTRGRRFILGVTWRL